MKTDTLRRRTFAASEVRAVGAPEDRRIELSVASTAPVGRLDGDEVLNLSGMDTSRVASGICPLLLNHDPDKLIGTVEAVRLDGDKLRACIRFGNGPLATEIFGDVTARIRRGVSIGYRYNETARRPDGSGYDVIKSELVEVSIASVPADATVGVGRNLKGNKMPVVTDIAEREAQVAAGLAEIAWHKAEGNCRTLGDRHGIPRAKTDRWLASRADRPAADLEADFRLYVLDQLPDDQPLVNGAPAVHPDRSEVRGDVMTAIGGLAAIRGVGDRAQVRSFEFGRMQERSDEMARATGRQPSGMYITMQDYLPAQRATQLAANHPALLPTDSLVGMMIDPLRAASVCMKMGAGFISLVHLSDIPGYESFTGGWYAEDEAAPEEAPTTRAVPLRPKRQTIRSKYSSVIALSSDPNVRGLARKNMLQTLMGNVDRAALTGSGTGANPRGILATVGIGSVAMGTNGEAIDWDAVCRLQRAVFSEDVTGDPSLFGYVTNHNVRHKLLTTERADGTAKFILDDTAPEKLAGFAAGYSSAIPANGTKGSGTALSSMVFGKWDDLVIAQFGGIDVIVDNVTEAAKANLIITTTSHFDFAVRHPESFAAIRDIVTV